jgi:hypothetical protein
MRATDVAEVADERARPHREAQARQPLHAVLGCC